MAGRPLPALVSDQSPRCRRRAGAPAAPAQRPENTALRIIGRRAARGRRARWLRPDRGQSAFSAGKRAADAASRPGPAAGAGGRLAYRLARKGLGTGMGPANRRSSDCGAATVLRRGRNRINTGEVPTFPHLRFSLALFRLGLDVPPPVGAGGVAEAVGAKALCSCECPALPPASMADRKSTRLNSSHLGISYA